MWQGAWVGQQKCVRDQDDGGQRARRRKPYIDLGVHFSSAYIWALRKFGWPIGPAQCTAVHSAGRLGCPNVWRVSSTLCGRPAEYTAVHSGCWPAG